jgi:hypothetical protein
VKEKIERPYKKGIWDAVVIRVAINLAKGQMLHILAGKASLRFLEQAILLQLRLDNPEILFRAQKQPWQLIFCFVSEFTLSRPKSGAGGSH